MSGGDREREGEEEVLMIGEKGEGNERMPIGEREERFLRRKFKEKRGG